MLKSLYADIHGPFIQGDSRLDPRRLAKMTPPNLKSLVVLVTEEDVLSARPLTKRKVPFVRFKEIAPAEPGWS
jgi:hypothetical protein